MMSGAEAPDSKKRTPAATGAGGLDWLAIWRQMVDAEHEQTERIAGPARDRIADHWAVKAPHFARAADRASQPDAFMRFVLPHLRVTDTVLDIGAGMGRHALFLARHVAAVLAVEPSRSMRQQFEQRTPDEAASRITVLPAAWPEAATPVCDVAISAHVAYGVREIGPFLTAMDQRARRACFVLLGLKQPSFVLAPFWERIHGTPRSPLPGALECLNVLHQLGIPARLALVPASRYSFADREEALEDLRWRLSLGPDSHGDARFLAALDELLEPDDAERLAPRNQPDHAAVLWWEPLE